jgi:hypothetical protein
MFVGHVAVALVAKRAAPRVSLGTFVLAALLADLLWTLFSMTGLERVTFKPGLGAANYFNAVSIAWSHSLLTAAIWGALFAGIYMLVRRDRRAAWIIFFVVLSHWPLDVISHKPDMPFAPGLACYVGLGLWNSVPATLVVEGGFWLVAIALYLSATSARSWRSIVPFWIGAAILTLLWHNNVAGPPPPPRTAAIGSLVVFCAIVAWAYWMNDIRFIAHERPTS